MSLVIDASVACKWFVEEDESAEAAQLLTRGESLVAPDLIIAEVASALCRKLQAGQMTTEQVFRAVEVLPRFFDELVPSALLASRSVAIAQVLRHPVYDCFYIALAEIGNARFVTADRILLRHVRKTPWVRLVTGAGNLI